MVQHARSEGGADAGAALFTLSCTRCPSTQRQVRGYFTPAGAAESQAGWHQGKRTLKVISS